MNESTKSKEAQDGMVLPKDGLRELALFAGAGGGILGGMLLGWRTVAAVEVEDYPRRVLLQRQADGILPRFPIWDDVCTFDGKPWRGKVDVISGGFPCQDISCAGKGEGITGARSGLWGEMARIIREVGPRYVFVENSPMLTVRGLGVVLGDLAEMGYDARWGVLGARDAGAPHKRDRIWICANSLREGSQGTKCESIQGTSRKPIRRGTDKGRPVLANAEDNQPPEKQPRQICEFGCVCENVADSNCRRSCEDSGSCKLWAKGSKQSPGHSRRTNEAEDEKGQGGVRWWNQDPAKVDHPPIERLQGSEWPFTQGGRERSTESGGCPTKPAVGRVAHELAYKLDINGGGEQ